MNVNTSINALNNIAADFNKIPGRINDAINNPESKEGLETVITDMMVNEKAYEANVNVLRSMNTVEDILLKELRDK